MWVFGYGSLVWKVDFPYSRRVVGYIEGYARRFWQASIDHRGVPGKPGRVVTLVPSDDPKEKVWGVAYEIDFASLSSLTDVREKRYQSTPSVLFYPAVSSDLTNLLSSFEVSVFIAQQSGELYLGPATISQMVSQIVDAEGPSGSNVDYVLQLANFMRQEISHASDPHLFELEEALHQALERVWGVAYYISPEDREKVIQHLDYREKDGYVRTPVQFFPSEADFDLPPFTLEFYLGSTNNPFFVGPDSLENMAQQIAKAVGPSGPNKEYLYNLAAAMRNLGAGVEDAHLFELEREVRKVELAGALAVEEVLLTHITGSAANTIVMDISSVSEQVSVMKA